MATCYASSLKVTRLISRRVVPPSITFLNADCLNVIMPPVTARYRISDSGRSAKIISLISSVRSKNSVMHFRPRYPVP